MASYALYDAGGEITSAGRFTASRTAAAAARSLAASLGHKVWPKPILEASADDDWRERERSRFDDGTYIRPPWEDNGYVIADHFCHVSAKDKNKVAFTEDEAKGHADRQTQMAPGRYLQTFFGDRMTPRTIELWVKEYIRHHAEVEVLFAVTADEIEEVYINGPDSCMAKDANEFSGPFHPVRVYAGPDLQLAYMKDENGDITARCLVWPDKKRRSTIYGDYDRLIKGLNALGYRTETGIDGARIQKHKFGRGFVLPYIDGPCAVGEIKDDDKHLVIGGYINAGWTNGLNYEYVEQSTCDNCENQFDSVVHIRGIDEQWCDTCIDESDHVFNCAWSGEYFHDEHEDRVEMANGTLWSRTQFIRSGFSCPGNGGNYVAHEGEVASNGTRYSITWLRANADQHPYNAIWTLRPNAVFTKPDPLIVAAEEIVLDYVFNVPPPPEPPRVSI